MGDDVAAVRGVLRDSFEPTVVESHRFGGTVAPEAAHLVLVSSYLPEVEPSLSSSPPRNRLPSSTSTRRPTLSGFTQPAGRHLL